MVSSLLSLFSVLTLSIFATNALPTQQQRHINKRFENATSAGYPVEVLWEFPNGTWLDSLAARPSGEIIASRLDIPEVWEFQVDSNGSTHAGPIFKFPNATSCSGIATLGQDVFAILVGSFNSSGGSVPGSWSVYLMDFTQTNRSVIVSMITPLTDLGEPNGISFFQSAVGQYLLITDSLNGALYSVNIDTFAITQVLSDQATQRIAGTEGGIDGIEVLDNVAFFTNYGAGYYCAFPLGNDSMPTGDTLVVDVAPRRNYPEQKYFDGLALDQVHAVAYIAAGSSNSIVQIQPNGTELVIAGSLYSTDIVQPTDVILGVTSTDSNVLYVTTGGGLAGLIGSMSTYVGAQLVAVQLPS